MGKISKNELNTSLKLEIENARTEIVNDFSGGVDKAASAELAKILNTNQQTTNTQLAQMENHFTESTSQIMAATRDISITGNQLISGFARKIKNVEIFASSDNGVYASWGFATSTGSQSNICKIGNNFQDVGGKAIVLGNDTSNFAMGTITLSGNTITIAWSKAGSPTGVALIRIKANYHGED